MLYILDEQGKALAQWHIGEPLPIVAGRVVTIQADGDELDIIIDALEQYSA
jgi:hypothetical protein